MPVLLFVLAGFCLVIAVWPRATWMAMASWQFKNPGGAELRPGMYVLRSISGVIAAVMLAGGGIWLLVTEDERECRKIMSQLGHVTRGNDFDQSSLSEVEDDLGARWDLNRTAAILEVDLVEDGRSVRVVAEDGEQLGTLDDEGAHPDCL